MLDSQPPSLRDLAVVMCERVPKSRHSAGFMGLKSYDDVFTGTAAVDFLVHQGFARSRGEAMRLGNSLIAEKFMHHVKDARQPLKDKPTSLYRWAHRVRVLSPLALLASCTTCMMVACCPYMARFLSVYVVRTCKRVCHVCTELRVSSVLSSLRRSGVFTHLACDNVYDPLAWQVHRPNELPTRVCYHWPSCG
jgi:hypothetical protein